MSGQKAIEVTTQALTAAAAEVKGVDHDTNYNCGEEEIQNTKHTANNLKGSSVFDKVSKQDKITDRFGNDITK